MSDLPRRKSHLVSAAAPPAVAATRSQIALSSNRVWKFGEETNGINEGLEAMGMGGAIEKHDLYGIIEGSAGRHQDGGRIEVELGEGTFLITSLQHVGVDLSQVLRQRRNRAFSPQVCFQGFCQSCTSSGIASLLAQLKARNAQKPKGANFCLTLAYLSRLAERDNTGSANDNAGRNGEGKKE